MIKPIVPTVRFIAIALLGLVVTQVSALHVNLKNTPNPFEVTINRATINIRVYENSKEPGYYNIDLASSNESENGIMLCILKAHKGGINTIHFSDDGQRFLTASDDGYAKEWETFTGKLLSEYNVLYRCKAACYTPSCDGWWNLNFISFSQDLGRYTFTIKCISPTERVIIR